MSKLVVMTRGGIKINDYALTGSEVTIGRFPNNTIQINNPGVSGHHARILIMDDIYTLEDLSSRNGTFVNRKRIERHVLEDSDQINFPNCKLVFLVNDVEDAETFKNFEDWRNKSAPGKSDAQHSS